MIDFYKQLGFEADPDGIKGGLGSAGADPDDGIEGADLSHPSRLSSCSLAAEPSIQGGSSKLTELLPLHLHCRDVLGALIMRARWKLSNWL